MIDIKSIRENPEYVATALKKRGVALDTAQLIELDDRRKVVLLQVEELRAKQNMLSEEVQASSGEDRNQKIEEGKKLKEETRAQEEILKELEESLKLVMTRFPNIPQDDVPEGGEDQNQVIRQVGEKPVFAFEPKDHFQLGEQLGILDVERAAKVSGSRFAYLKNDAVLLELALIRYVMDMGIRSGFTPISPPVLIRAEMMQKMGYVDTPEDLAERYYLEKNGLFLVGTAEQAVGPMHADEVFEEKELPRRYIAFSTCFREEAGSYGKDTRGILRVHQFDKVELFSFCHPEKSREEHGFLLNFEEDLWRALGIPYQVMQLAAGDMSRPAVSTIDIEAWLPGQGRYREVSSASNTTDFQSRRLNIRMKKKDGKLEFVHMLNATGFPIGRTLIAIMENYQQEDGSITVPEILQKFVGKSVIEKQ
ncbi:MAG: serine--tRNA ligase [bacterium]|nr:serine--tRNA ligase [bacterium]